MFENKLVQINSRSQYYYLWLYWFLVHTMCYYTEEHLDRLCLLVCCLWWSESCTWTGDLFDGTSSNWWLYRELISRNRLYIWGSCHRRSGYPQWCPTALLEASYPKTEFCTTYWWPRSHLYLSPHRCRSVARHFHTLDLKLKSCTYNTYYAYCSEL